MKKPNPKTLNLPDIMLDSITASLEHDAFYPDTTFEQIPYFSTLPKSEQKRMKARCVSPKFLAEKIREKLLTSVNKLFKGTDTYILSQHTSAELIQLYKNGTEIARM